MRIDHITRGVNLALQECTLFTDCFRGGRDDAYAQVRTADCTEFYAINSDLFAEWLHDRYYHVYGDGLSDYALRNIMSCLSAEADDANQIPVFLRFGYWEGAVYWDLGDDKWRCIRITPDGWTVVPHADTPVRFRRTEDTKALPDPERGGTLDELRELLSIKDDYQWAIIVAAITCPFLPQGDMPLRVPALALFGPPMSGKTTLSLLLRQLLDPSFIPEEPVPGTVRQWVACARENAVLVFDNVWHLSPCQLESLLSLLEGNGLTYRVGRKYYDQDIFSETRPIIINAPNDNAANLYASIRKYCFGIALKEIRYPIHEEDLDEHFDKLQPRLVSAIADRVSAGLREWERIEVRLTGDLGRYYYKLLDAIHWAVGVEKGMNERSLFLDALAASLRDNNTRSKR
jgi:hypothetical protein